MNWNVPIQSVQPLVPHSAGSSRVF